MSILKYFMFVMEILVQLRWTKNFIRFNNFYVLIWEKTKYVSESKANKRRCSAYHGWEIVDSKNLWNANKLRENYKTMGLLFVAFLRIYNSLIM